MRIYFTFILASMLFIQSCSKINFKENIIINSEINKPDDKSIVDIDNNGKIGTTNNDVIDFKMIDFDGDSDYDIVIILRNYEGNNSVFLLDNINSKFEKKKLFSTSKYFNLIDCKDINNDDHIDIVLQYDSRYSRKPELMLINGVITNKNGYATIYFNDNNNEFKESYLIKNPDWLEYIDIDNDNNLDLLVATKSLNSLDTITIFQTLQNIDSEPITITNNENSINSIYISDINNDTYEDVILVTETKDKIIELICYLNSSTNSFKRMYIDINLKMKDIISIGDFDNDKLPDLVIANNSNYKNFDAEITKGSVWLYKNLGNLNFSKQLIIGDLKWPESTYTLDFDFDSDLDIVVNDSTNIIYLENAGNLYFNRHILNISLKEKYLDDFFSEFIDIDYDNDMDLYFRDLENSCMYLYLNNGYNDFLKYFITNKFGFDKLKFTDIDGDKMKDIVVNFKKIKFTDIDDDKRIFINHAGSNKIVWLKNCIRK